MKKRLINAVENIKTAIMIVLFGAVISLLVLYISELSSTWSRESTGDALLPRLRTLASDREEGYRIPSANYVLPAEIVLKTDRQTVSLSVWGNGILEECYAKVASLLSFSFEDASAFTRQSPTEGEALWSAVSRLDECIYLRYHAALPYQVVLYHTSAFSETPVCVEDVTPLTVKELACYMESEGETYRYHVLIRSADGSVYHRSEIVESTDIYAYSLYEMEKLTETTGSFVLCEFAGTYYADTERQFASDMTPVLMAPPVTQNFTFETDPLTPLTESDPDINAVLRLFAYNPNKINRHDEAENTIVYVESHGVLRVSPASLLYTAAQNGGISVTDALDGGGNGNDLYDALLFASRLFDGLREADPRYLGGDCHPVLTSVTGEGGRIELRYRYYADNRAILNQPCEIVLTFQTDKLVSAEIESFAATAAAGETPLYSGAWIANRFYKIVGPLSSLDVVYRYTVGETVSAEWIAVAAESEEQP